jgi:predicted TIM-barrel fold metal-dependent hydrolase
MSYYLETLSDLEKGIVRELEKLKIYDCHEHLPPEKSRIASKPDAFTLFSHYCQHDLYTAGMDKETMAKILWQPGDIDWKWKIFKPFYEKIRDTSYSRAAHITMERFYGETELNDGNYRAVSQRVAENNTKGLYRRVLTDACGIIASINCDGPLDDTDGGLLYQTARTPDDIRSRADVAKRLTKNGIPPANIDEILEYCDEFAKDVKSRGGVAIKFMCFPINGATKEKAQETLGALLTDEALRLPRGNPLNEFVLVNMMKAANRAGLVCQMHTGYWNDFRELNPANLLPFVIEDRETRIDLFHVGYPNVREAIMLGKVWPNVRMNMAWTYLISQHFAYEALDEMLEMLPDNKIFGFGGDYYVVEKVFGHLCMARETIARALAKRVNEKSMTLSRALEIGRKMLYDNPKEFYGFPV